MYVCYVDESGCTGELPSAISPVQPVLVIAGVIIDHSLIRSVTREFLALKQRFFPRAVLQDGRVPRRLPDWVLAEIKGSDVRRSVRSVDRRQRRQAIGFLDGFLSILEHHGLKLVGRVWIKAIGSPINGRGIYTYSIQAICTTFQAFLAEKDDLGFIIVDSRTKPQNALVAHSIFTQKFKGTGDDHSRVIEMPTFGHSENHVGIQIADLLSSAILFPMATFSYCTGYVTNLHVQPGFSEIKDRFGSRIQSLQYRFCDFAGRRRGGITVCDGLAKRSGGLLFH
jgi:hypothetical protein